jgi:integrase
VLVLAAVHAARAGAIRAAQLDDVDLGNRRLIIAGRVRPIDQLTHQILLDWL